ncbi:MAG: acyl-CoA dehydrogenase family protein [Paracoccaceae bacterium]|nr:acyl-CoA dehydrogenase family protein [Paracoccaceae bacterium]
MPTHDVLNQPPVRGDLDLWAGDPVLCTHAPDPGAAAQALGRVVTREAGRAANRYAPELHTHDRHGRRLDRVTFHPAYHDLLRLGLEAGYAAGPWTGGSHVAHAALVYLFSQVEPGVCCPMTMSYAAVPALGDAFPDWAAKLTTPAYDPAEIPLAGKAAATLGMAMTEKQGGSDVRANTTRAERADGAYRLTGHKWFCSAPMSDGFLTLAQAPGGLTSFLVPRWREGGPNAIRLVRLKDKLGNRANASAEIEYEGAVAHRLGEEGEGVKAILKMVHHTRLDTAIAPAGLMRAALAEAHHWVAHRSAFQRRLVDQPLMRRLMADLVLDWEGATALGFRVARAFDAGERPFARIAVALAKYLSNARCPQVVFEAMQALGGMGYVEDTGAPMLYREAPLNAIWEGSGNVICLDILRTLARDPEAADALAAELDRPRSPPYDTARAAYRRRWTAPPGEADARAFADDTATLLTAATLTDTVPEAVAGAYIATRLGARRGLTSGAILALDEAAILARLGPPA